MGDEKLLQTTSAHGSQLSIVLGWAAAGLAVVNEKLKLLKVTPPIGQS